MLAAELVPVLAGLIAFVVACLFFAFGASRLAHRHVDGFGPLLSERNRAPYVAGRLAMYRLTSVLAAVVGLAVVVSRV